MFNIQQFLERIKSSRNDGLLVHSNIVKVLKETIAIEVPLESIKVKSGVIFLKNIPQAARSEIFLKKVRLLEEINKVHKGVPLKDIR